jgi:hypothetical protein
VNVSLSGSSSQRVINSNSGFCCQAINPNDFGAMRQTGVYHKPFIWRILFFDFHF